MSRATPKGSPIPTCSPIGHPEPQEGAPSAAYPKLQHFEWLVGEWQGGAKGEAKLSCHWAPNKSFLLMDYTVDRAEGGPLTLEDLAREAVDWPPPPMNLFDISRW